jgi:D-sedoheptulose 7-phosphate isomerase
MRTLQDFASGYVSEVHDMLDKLDLGSLEAVAEVLANCEGIVWLAGNGGSASLASHMATDLQLAGIRAVALTDVATITTYANDVNYYETFSEQTRQLVRQRDILVLISTSGQSRNMVFAADEARVRCAALISVTGRDGGKLGPRGDIQINIPSYQTGVVQDLHEVAWHIVTYYLMERKRQRENG